jgi:hypothetical protein
MTPGTYALLIHPNEQVTEPRGCVVHPDDVLGVEQTPNRSRWSGCCGQDGRTGMNVVCAGCGAEVATQQSDCFTQNQVVLDFDATMVDHSGDEL